jgi:hypothetical protein
VLCVYLSGAHRTGLPGDTGCTGPRSSRARRSRPMRSHAHGGTGLLPSSGSSCTVADAHGPGGRTRTDHLTARTPCPLHLRKTPLWFLRSLVWSETHWWTREVSASRAGPPSCVRPTRRGGWRMGTSRRTISRVTALLTARDRRSRRHRSQRRGTGAARQTDVSDPFILFASQNLSV